jgi:hypothetical protein
MLGPFARALETAKIVRPGKDIPLFGLEGAWAHSWQLPLGNASTERKWQSPQGRGAMQDCIYLVVLLTVTTSTRIAHA